MLDALPNGMVLALHEETLNVAMLGDIKVWLTTHRLILWDRGVVVIPLPAVGTMVFTHIVRRGAIIWGMIFSLLTIGCVVAGVLLSRSSTSPKVFTPGIVIGTLVFFVASVAFWLSISGPWVWQIYGSGGHVMREYALPPRLRDPIAQLSAETADAIVRILPKPYSDRPLGRLDTP